MKYTLIRDKNYTITIDKAGKHVNKKRDNIHLPYSLHDSQIKSFDVFDDVLKIRFESGITSSIEPYEVVDASLLFSGVDYDFTSIYVLTYSSIRSGNNGKFTGLKMSLKAYIEDPKFEDCKLEIIDETYGYNQTKLAGFMNHEQKISEFFLEIYHHGDMEYIVADR